jgi:hypothetical protein
LAAAALQSCAGLSDACNAELNRLTAGFLSVVAMSALSIIWDRRFAENAGR